MSRNQNRAFGNNPEVQQPPVQPNPPPIPAASPEAPPSPFNFIVPTEMVDLPSKGEFYPEGHPLHNVDAIEIKHMTAKEEDILTSATLLKKGLAIDKMLQSIIVDKRIKVKDLLIGDKNALVIASRIFGYGPDYKVEIQCVHCDNSYEAVYDLSALQNKSSTNFGKVDKTANNTFTLVLPKSQMLVEFKLLTSQDEEKLTKDKKGGSMKLLKLIVVSINEQTDGFYVERALQSLPILDVSTLKKTYAMAMPDVNMVQDIECTACGEISTLGVPLNAGFFWPDI
jgi:hypothetical protein